MTTTLKKRYLLLRGKIVNQTMSFEDEYEYYRIKQACKDCAGTTARFVPPLSGPMRIGSRGQAVWRIWCKEKDCGPRTLKDVLALEEWFLTLYFSKMPMPVGYAFDRRELAAINAGAKDQSIMLRK